MEVREIPKCSLIYRVDLHTQRERERESEGESEKERERGRERTRETVETLK